MKEDEVKEHVNMMIWVQDPDGEMSGGQGLFSGGIMDFYNGQRLV